jgi:hypothetical protein
MQLVNILKPIKLLSNASTMQYDNLIVGYNATGYFET